MNFHRPERFKLRGGLYLRPTSDPFSTEWVMCAADGRVLGVGYSPKDLPEIVAALAPSGDGWQPIGTAPKDGTHIMFWDDLTGYQIGYWGTYPAIDDGPDCTFWTDGAGPIVGDGQDGPSHWRPLPARPQPANDNVKAKADAA